MRLILFVVILLANTVLCASKVYCSESATSQKSQPDKMPHPPEMICATYQGLLNAIADNDLPSFVQKGDDEFRTTTSDHLRDLNSQLEGRMMKGFWGTYLGHLNQDGYRVDIWKLSFADRGNDLLTIMKTKDGWVSSFRLE